MTEFECIINWDEQITEGKTARYALCVRTGHSILLSNRLTVLKLKQPAEGVAVESELFNILNEITQEHPAAMQRTGPPEIRIYGIPYSPDRVFTFAAVWGIVLNGKRTGKHLKGDFRFVIVATDQLVDCLKTVFEGK